MIRKLLTKEDKIVFGYISIQGMNGNLTIAEIEFNALNAGIGNLDLSVIDVTDTKNNPASVEDVVNSTVCITQAPTQEKTAESEKTPVETATTTPNETTTAHETPTPENETPGSTPALQTTKIETTPTATHATPAKAKITQTSTQPAYARTPLTSTPQAKSFETIPGFEAILAIFGLIIVLRWLK